MNLRLHSLFVSLLVLHAALASAQEVVAADLADMKVAELIQRLGDEEFSKREEASRALVEMDEKARSALEFAAARNADPEVRWRAAQALAEIARREIAAKGRLELQRLRGTWYTVLTSNHGTTTGEDVSDTMTYEGNRFTQKRNGVVWAAGFVEVVNPTSDPKQIEYILDQGEYAGYHFRSIYLLDGDNHQICSDSGRSQTDTRPKEFTGQAGFLRVMKQLNKPAPD